MNVKIIKVEQDNNFNNYLVFTLFLKKMQEIDGNINERINKANEQCDFKFNYYQSYDNMDYNGHFFETCYRDEMLSHTIKNGKVTITDSFVCELIKNDCKTFIENLIQGDDKMTEYKAKEYKISIEQIDADIKTLNREFERFGGAWEFEDGGYGCISIAENELELCKGIADRYPFIYKYEPSNFDHNPNDLSEDWSDMIFTVEDFNHNIANGSNYDKVDAVAFDFKDNFIAMLESLKKEIQWLPSRFRQEFVELICECQQTANSIRKNCEYFADEIDNELTADEKNRMYTIL